MLAAASHANNGSAVFGSFLNLRFAEEAQTLLLDRLGIATDIVRAEVNGVVYHRIVTPPADERSARDIIARANQAGYSAWYLPYTGDPRAIAGSPAQPTQPRGPGVASPTVTPSVEVQQGIGDAAHSPQAAGAFDLKMQPQLAGATGAPIDVPYFDNVDIRIDGRVDEAVWAQVPAYDNMLVIDPDTMLEPTYETISRFIYTEKGLYVSAVMKQPSETLVARLSARDQYINRDSFGITLDTSGEGIYGYWFVVNLGGSLMDGKVTPERNFTEQWDGAWYGTSAVLADGWSTEMFLPWSMMTMPQQSAERKMGFWVNRKVAHMDERYGWPALPFTAARFMSALQPMEVPGLEPKQQWAVFPYTSVTHNQIENGQRYRVGADVFWRPTSNTQITATLKPDFGTVESDDVIVNLCVEQAAVQ